VLTACSLASFSLSDCVLSLLGRTMEIIPAATLAAFANLGTSKTQAANQELDLPGQALPSLRPQAPQREKLDV
jgi:hypothetical protein